MQANGHLKTFEYGKNLIHVHAYKSVLDGWALDVVALVESRQDGSVVARSITPGDRRFASYDAAIAEGKRMAIELIDGSGH
ncbi:MAG: hypothetical protein D6815_07575 [Candidatus Dadabacteria bacterium]|nr:MAG: hypothetical protein D6815_07575 [Candidatus Dadabacteria bacterium]